MNVTLVKPSAYVRVVGEVPGAEELLHPRVQHEEAPHQRVDRGHERRIAIAALEVEQRADRPVAGVVPGRLGGHHLGVAHQPVLPVVEPQERVVEPQVVDVERFGPRRDVLAGRRARDQVGGEVVADRDEVRAGRVERVGEDARLADQRPAVRREHPLAAVRVVLEREEILQAIRLQPLDHSRALRLELAQPVDRTLVAVDS